MKKRKQDIRVFSFEYRPSIFDKRRLTAVVINGEAWFTATSVFKLLNIKDKIKAFLKLDEGQKDGSFVKGNTLISECGLFLLLFQNKTPEFQRIKKWVTKVVLPGINSDFRKRKRWFSMLKDYFYGLFGRLFIISVFIFMIIGIDRELFANNRKPLIRSQIDKIEAIVICRNVYREFAKYDAKVGFRDPYKVFKTKNSWVIKLEGRLQNVFGAWHKICAHCEIPFERTFKEYPYDSRNREVFEYQYCK